MCRDPDDHGTRPQSRANMYLKSQSGQKRGGGADRLVVGCNKHHSAFDFMYEGGQELERDNHSLKQYFIMGEGRN